MSRDANQLTTSDMSESKVEILIVCSLCLGFFVLFLQCHVLDDAMFADNVQNIELTQ